MLCQLVLYSLRTSYSTCPINEVGFTTNLLKPSQYHKTTSIIHSFTESLRFILNSTFKRRFPDLSLRRKCFPFRHRDLRENPQLDNNFSRKGRCYRLDRTVALSAPSLSMQHKDIYWYTTYLPHVEQKNLLRALPLSVFLSTYSFRFSSPSMMTFSVSIIRFVAAAKSRKERCQRYQYPTINKFTYSYQRPSYNLYNDKYVLFSSLRKGPGH